MLTSTVSSECSCVQMSQASGPGAKSVKDREELYCFHQTQTVDFCHVNSEILDEIQEIKKAKWNGFKTNISEVIELKGWGCAFLVSFSWQRNE